jgi:SAM-dependent methyltransferase
MNAENRQSHWEKVYNSKGENEVSWFEETPALSLELIAQTGATTASPIIDIGGGASRLVDVLLERSFRGLAVLDTSEAALATAKKRLGERASLVRWIVADVTTWRPEAAAYDVWHDRATFHFLVDEGDRAAYVERMTEAVKLGGRAIIATFALDGPERCSGLPVARYDARSLDATIGGAFDLVGTRRQVHTTPWASEQQFQFSLFQRRG